MKPHLALNEKEMPPGTVIKLFATLVLVAVLLRLAYAGHLFEDDGLWFTAAAEILRGKALYSDIYFDKPPLLPLLYALLFKLFGSGILTIRLFAAIYSVAVAFILYRFGALLYDRRKGALAAVLFVVGSTTFTTGQFQGLNTDALMTLPYSLAALLFVRSRLGGRRTGARRGGLAFAAGLACGLALQTNPKGLFDLLFFGLVALFPGIGPKAEALNQGACRKTTDQLRSAASGLGLAVCGTVVGALPFWVYMAASDSLSSYWFSVWVWGARYADYYSWNVSVATALRQSLSYFALNNLFLVGLLTVLLATISRLRQRRAQGAQPAAEDVSMSQSLFCSDVILWLWFAASYAGMSVGGRFFGHYFLQILPALCLLASRGLTILAARLSSAGKKRAWQRRVVYGLLALGCLLTLTRYHARTVLLAADWARGAKSDMTSTWFYERVQRQDRQAAEILKQEAQSRAEGERPDGAAAAPRQQQEGKPYLFVWGYRPEIYYWSGFLPASRYLSSQLLTGVPADVHYFGDEFMPILDEKTTALHRARLLQELQKTRPQFIVDELAAYNSALAMDNYPELKAFLGDYKLLETPAKVFIYALRRPKDKKTPGS